MIGAPRSSAGRKSADMAHARRGRMKDLDSNDRRARARGASARAASGDTGVRPRAALTAVAWTRGYGAPRECAGCAGASPQGWTSNWVPAAPGSLNALADRLHTERQSARAREREPQTARQNERDRETERERERKRQGERQRETESRDRETETERDRETESHSKDVRARARARQSAAARGGVRGATSEIRQD